MKPYTKSGKALEILGHVRSAEGKALAAWIVREVGSNVRYTLFPSQIEFR